MSPASIQSLFEQVAAAKEDRLALELLIAHVLKTSREYVFSHPEHVLETPQIAAFSALWNRYLAGEPVAYLRGYKEFWGLNFSVDDRVLVPRPETEHLVETVLQLVDGLDEVRLLDVGTGSGAIACALAHELPEAQVWASDVSSDAVDVAQSNAKSLGLDRIDMRVSDLLSAFDLNELDLDVLVANLPYIGIDKFHFVEKKVEDHEPHVALFGGTDGLRLYDQLFTQLQANLSRPRWILGEFGCFQREALEAMIRSHFPKARVDFHQDLAGLDRYFVIDRG
jgi:release factor glutamine methyltransferase